MNDANINVSIEQTTNSNPSIDVEVQNTMDLSNDVATIDNLSSQPLLSDATSDIESQSVEDIPDISIDSGHELQRSIIDGWMPTYGKLHSGNTRTCVNCQAPLYYTNLSSWNEYLSSHELLYHLKDHLCQDTFISGLICGELTGGDLPSEYCMSDERLKKMRQNVQDFRSMSSTLCPDQQPTEISSQRLLEEMITTVLPTPAFTLVLERRLAIVSNTSSIIMNMLQQSCIPKTAFQENDRSEFKDFELHYQKIDELASLLNTLNCSKVPSITLYQQLSDILDQFSPRSLSKYFSFLYIGPEIVLPLSPETTTVSASSCSPTNSRCEAKAAIDDRSGTYWQSNIVAGTVYYYINTALLSKASSLLISWRQNMYPSRVEVAFRIAGKKQFITFAVLCGTNTSSPDIIHFNIPSAANELRLAMSGFPSLNSHGVYAIEKITMRAPAPSVSITKATFDEVNEWLFDATHDIMNALCTSEERYKLFIELGQIIQKWAFATSSPGSILLFIKLLMHFSEFIKDTTSSLKSTEMEVEFTLNAKKFLDDINSLRLAHATNAADLKDATTCKQCAVQARFDGANCSSGIQIDSSGKTVYSKANSHQYAVVNCKISAGKAQWRFRLGADTHDDEMTCFGAATLPVRISSYDTSPQLWMLRGYNGNLYSRGNQLSKSIGKVHPGDIITVVADMTKGTMAFKINDEDYGIVFTDLLGHDIYPAVSFYGSGKAVTLIDIDIIDKKSCDYIASDSIYLSSIIQYCNSDIDTITTPVDPINEHPETRGIDTLNMSNTEVLVGGTMMFHCLLSRPVIGQESSIIYDVGKAFVTLRGRVGFTDGTFTSGETKTTGFLLFSIFGDSRLLWESSLICIDRPTDIFNISIYDIQMLDLRVKIVEFSGTVHALWIDPLLLKAEQWICNNCGTENDADLSSCTICYLPHDGNMNKHKQSTIEHDWVENSPENNNVQTSIKNSTKTDISATIDHSVTEIRSLDNIMIHLLDEIQDSNCILGRILDTKCVKKFPEKVPLVDPQQFLLASSTSQNLDLCELTPVVFELLFQCLQDFWSSYVKQEDTPPIPLSNNDHKHSEKELMKKKCLSVVNIVSEHFRLLKKIGVTLEQDIISGIMIVAIRELLESIIKAQMKSDDLDDESQVLQVAASTALINGFDVFYPNNVEKLQLFSSFFEKQSQLTFCNKARKQMFLFVLRYFAAPCYEGIQILLPSTIIKVDINKDGYSKRFEHSVNAVITNLVCVLQTEEQNTEYMCKNQTVEVFALLHNYQMALFAEVVESVKQNASQTEVVYTNSPASCNLFALQQKVVTAYICQIFNSCKCIAKEESAKHSQRILFNKSPTGKSLLKHNARPKLFQLLPWIFSFLSLLRRQEWLIQPCLTASIQLLTTLDNFCFGSHITRSSEFRLENLEVKKYTKDLQSVTIINVKNNACLTKLLPSAVNGSNIFHQLYTGDKDHFEGQIGFQFEAMANFAIVALGRSVNPNNNGGQLCREHSVRLWDEASQKLIAHVVISATSPKDDMGYAYEGVHSMPIKITRGKLYRITTHEYVNSGDPWYKKDSQAESEEIYNKSYIKILRDCYSSGSTSYPNYQNLIGGAYGVPTFFMEGHDPMQALDIFVPPHGISTLKFQTNENISPDIVCNGYIVPPQQFTRPRHDKWLTAFTRTTFIDGIHSVDFIAKSMNDRGQCCIGMDWLINRDHQQRSKGFLGYKHRSCSIGWMPAITSLWICGRQYTYGEKHTVVAGDCLSMTINFDEGLLEFSLNGNTMGVAFGHSKESTVWCDIKDFPKALSPAVSMHDLTDNWEVRPSGLLGSSLQIHWTLDYHISLASCCGRLASALLAAIPINGIEEEMLPWLESPMLSGGIIVDRSQTNDYNVVFDQSFFHILGDDMTDSGPASIILNWLSTMRPDKSMLSKHGSFSSCERLECAALIRHAPAHVIQEAQAVYINATQCDGVWKDQLTPSKDILIIWRLITSLRHWLIKARHELQHYHESDPEIASKPQSLIDQKLDKSGGLDSNGSHVLPECFEELLAQVCARAAFLCRLDRPSRESRLRIDSQVALRRLASNWSGANTPSSLQPMIQQWQDLPGVGSSRWGGIAKVLQAQYKWRTRSKRHSSSSNFNLGGKDDDDQSLYKDSYVAMMKACDLYVRHGTCAPPNILSTLLEKRERRCDTRIAGLEAMHLILSNLSFNIAMHNAIMFLRPALRGFTEDERICRENRNNPNVGDQKVLDLFRPTVRHHYLKGLEGCNRDSIANVRASFYKLYNFLAETLCQSISEPTNYLPLLTPLHLAICSAWTLDFDAQDHEFILKSNILSTLEKLFSFQSVCQHAKMELSMMEIAKSDMNTNLFSTHCSWTPFSSAYILADSIHTTPSLTRRDLLQLLLQLPKMKPVLKTSTHLNNDLGLSNLARLYAEKLGAMKKKVFVGHKVALSDKVLQFGTQCSHSLNLEMLSQSGLGASMKSITGKPSYVIIPALGPVQDFTIEMWVYPVNILGNQSLRSDDGFLPQSVFIELVDGQVQVAVNGNIPRVQRFTCQTLQCFAWMHIAITYRGQQKELNCTFNGVQHSPKIYTTVVPIISLRKAKLGAWTNISDDLRSISSITKRQFYGSIAHVRVWNIARSAHEIRRDYQRVIPYGDNTKLLALWCLTEGNGDTTKDIRHTSENEGYLTIINCQWVEVRLPIVTCSLINTNVREFQWSSLVRGIIQFQHLARNYQHKKYLKSLYGLKSVIKAKIEKFETLRNGDTWDEIHCLPTKPSGFAQSHSMIFTIECTMLMQKQIRKCAWIVFQFLTTIGTFGIHERRDNEAMTSAGCAKKKRTRPKQSLTKTQHQSEVLDSKKHPSREKNMSSKNAHNDQLKLKYKVGSDAAKVAATNRVMEEPELHTLWFSIELHRKLFHVLENELYEANYLLRIIEPKSGSVLETRANCMRRSISIAAPVVSKDNNIHKYGRILSSNRLHMMRKTHFFNCQKDQKCYVDAQEIEQWVFELLSFILSQSKSPPVRKRLCKQRLISELIDILQVSSPRLQRVVKLLLRVVCYRKRPSQVSALLGSETKILDILLNQIADGMYSATLAPAKAKGYGYGDIVHISVGESIALIRFFLETKAWTRLAGDFLYGAIQGVAQLLKTIPPFELASKILMEASSSQILRTQATGKRAIAALAVFGAYADSLRVGGLVSVTMSDMFTPKRSTYSANQMENELSEVVSITSTHSTGAVATLISYDEVTRTARVVFEDGMYTDHFANLNSKYNIQEMDLRFMAPYNAGPVTASCLEHPTIEILVPELIYIILKHKSKVGHYNNKKAQLWWLQMYSGAMQAISIFLSIWSLQLPSTIVKLLLQNSMVKLLLNDTLAPVRFKSFISIPLLQRRKQFLYTRLTEAMSTNGKNIYSKIDTTEKLNSVATLNASQNDLSSCGEHSCAEGENDDNGDLVIRLVEMGFEFDLCRAALTAARGDLGNAIEWLTCRQQPNNYYCENSNETQVVNSTCLSQEGFLYLHENLHSTKEIILRAKELQDISSLPLILNIRALELANSDANRAMDWLLEYGHQFAESCHYATDRFQQKNQMIESDLAALEDLGTMEQLFQADSRCSNIAGSSSNWEERISENVVPTGPPFTFVPVIPTTHSQAISPSGENLAHFDPGCLLPNVLLSVPEGAFAPVVQQLGSLAWLSHKVGTYRGFSDRDKKVCLAFINPETGEPEEAWYSPSRLYKIDQIFGESFNGVSSIEDLTLQTEEALIIRFARLTVALLLNAKSQLNHNSINVSSQQSKGQMLWSNSTLDLFGSAKEYLGFLKLVLAPEIKSTYAGNQSFIHTTHAVEINTKLPYCCTESKTHTCEGSLLGMLENITLQILQEERELEFQLLSKDGILNEASSSSTSFTDLSMEGNELCKLPVDESNKTKRQRLCQALLEECVCNFDTCSELASKCSPTFTSSICEYESLHPYFYRSDYTVKVEVRSAQLPLCISFDDRCSFASKSKLIFYADEKCLNLIAAIDYQTLSKHLSSGLPNIIIHTTQFWYRFVAQEKDLNTNYGYGFRFQVSSLGIYRWLNEFEVVQKPTLEWACWILEFLLKEQSIACDKGFEGSIFTRNLYSRRLFNTLIRHLRSPRAQLKSHVVKLLLQLLQKSSLHLFSAAEYPTLKPLQNICNLVVEQAEQELRFGASLFLRHSLLQWVELAIVTNQAAKEFDLMGRSKIQLTTDLKESILNAPVPFSDKSITEKMNDLIELMNFILGQTNSLSHHLLLMFWLSIHGSSKVIESSHPYIYDCSPISGDIRQFQGAQCLQFIFDPQCSILPGSKLTISTFKSSSKNIQLNDPATSMEFLFDKGVESLEVKKFDGDVAHYEFSTAKLPYNATTEIANTNTQFGFRFTICAVGLSIQSQLGRLNEEILNNFRQNILQSQASTTPTADDKHPVVWTYQMDRQLVEWINRVQQSQQLATKTTEHSCTSIQPHEIYLNPCKDEVICPQLLEVPLDCLRMRYGLIKLFNDCLQLCLHYIDMSSPSDSWRIASKLQQLNHLIFFDLKRQFVDATIEATVADDSCVASSSTVPTVRIHLDRFKAAESYEDREFEPSISHCFFAQGFYQLNSVDPVHFRRKIDSKGRLFSVKFRGEEGVDWGGVYREGINLMVEDLFSSKFHLFILCPNGSHNLGSNRGMYIPNPICTNPQAMEMFSFVGKLLGISLRTQGDLPFYFPSLVWKQLLGQTLTIADIEATDTIFLQMLRAIESCEDNGIKNEEQFDIAFNSLDLRFTILDSAGREVNLISNGCKKPVTYSNRLEYCKLAKEYRMNEGKSQISAIRHGFSTVFPIAVTTILTWQEMEQMTCGSPKIDIEIWKQHTRYDGYSSSDPAVARFWEVLESFTDEQRSEFIQFSWGRCRLPQGKWPQPFKLTKKCGQDALSKLPVAHTCFFSVELPPYESYDVMKRMILTALKFGFTGILIA